MPVRVIGGGESSGEHTTAPGTVEKKGRHSAENEGDKTGWETFHKEGNAELPSR